MADALVRETLAGSAKWEQDGRVLSMNEKPVSVFEGQFLRVSETDQFCRSVVRQNVSTGDMANSNDLLILRFSPFSIYLVTKQASLENINAEFRNRLTDVSHGKCMLSAAGDSVMDFLRDYCSEDPFASQSAERGMLKTRFIDYDLVIWWRSGNEANLLIDRSYALSFVDFLHSLFMRR